MAKDAQPQGDQDGSRVIEVDQKATSGAGEIKERSSVYVWKKTD